MKNTIIAIMVALLMIACMQVGSLEKKLDEREASIQELQSVSDGYRAEREDLNLRLIMARKALFAYQGFCETEYKLGHIANQYGPFIDNSYTDRILGN